MLLKENRSQFPRDAYEGVHLQVQDITEPPESIGHVTEIA